MTTSIKQGLAALALSIALGSLGEAHAQGFGFGFSNYGGYGIGGTGVSVGIGVNPLYGGVYPGYYGYGYGVPGYAGYYGAPMVGPMAVTPGWGMSYYSYRPAYVGGFRRYAYPGAYVYRPW